MTQLTTPTPIPLLVKTSLINTSSVQSSCPPPYRPHFVRKPVVTSRNVSCFLMVSNLRHDPFNLGVHDQHKISAYNINAFQNKLVTRI